MNRKRVTNPLGKNPHQPLTTNPAIGDRRKAHKQTRRWPHTAHRSTARSPQTDTDGPTLRSAHTGRTLAGSLRGGGAATCPRRAFPPSMRRGSTSPPSGTRQTQRRIRDRDGGRHTRPSARQCPRQCKLGLTAIAPGRSGSTRRGDRWPTGATSRLSDRLPRSGGCAPTTACAAIAPATPPAPAPQAAAAAATTRPPRHGAPRHRYRQ